MRKIDHNGTVLKLDAFSDISTNYDKVNFKEDTEYVTIDSAVLGNKMGLNTVDGLDQSSALAAVHGRKYNNGRISIPFKRSFVTDNYPALDKLIQGIADKASSQCSALQQMMSDEQVAQGRESAMRSQAIRDAKTEILARGSILDQDLFNEANRVVRASVVSKVFYQHGVSVSARRINDQEGIADKGLFKRKSISSESGASLIAYVATADESGLKRVPIMTSQMRSTAEGFVYEFAVVCLEAVKKIGKDVNGESCLACLEEIYQNMPHSGNQRIEMPEYNEEELRQIAEWKNLILEAYKP